MRLLQNGSSRLVTSCVAALLAAGLVAGCGTGGSGLERDAARQLQARVLEVTQASSQNDPNAALEALEGLETELAAAQQRGDITEERRRSITTIATAVRADLEDAVELAAAKAAEEKAAAEQPPATTPSPTPEAPAAAATQPQQGNSGQEQDKDADNKGEDKGKGKD